MLVEMNRTVPILPKVRRVHEPHGPADATEGLLLVGHGSRCLMSESQMRTIGDQVAAAHPDVRIGVGFLEMTDPPAGEVLDTMVTTGCTRIVILPLMLLAASHAKSDVPAIVLEARLRHPGVDIVFGSPLGVVPELIEIAATNIERSGARGLPLFVVARGTSDPDANGDATKAARLLAEWVQTSALEVGFTGMTWPSVPDALDRIASLGMTRVALFFWFLCNGKLIERARSQVADFSARTGIEVLDAGYFGPDPALTVVIWRRYREALEAAPTVNCDTCAYRAPFPGMEDKAGQAIGVGHSHFAAEHRGAGHHHHGGHHHGDEVAGPGSGSPQ